MCRNRSHQAGSVIWRVSCRKFSNHNPTRYRRSTWIFEELERDYYLASLDWPTLSATRYLASSACVLDSVSSVDGLISIFAPSGQEIVSGTVGVLLMPSPGKTVVFELAGNRFWFVISRCVPMGYSVIKGLSAVSSCKKNRAFPHRSGNFCQARR